MSDYRVLVRTLRIDETLWDEASVLRRQDWRASVADLLDDGILTTPHQTVLIHVESSRVRFELEGENDTRAELAIDRALLNPLIDEYLKVIARMQTEEVSGSSAKMQALDMAKKVVHDRGAKLIAAHAAALASSHEAFRRLFTLILSLLVDVTALKGVRAHQPISR